MCASFNHNQCSSQVNSLIIIFHEISIISIGKPNIMGKKKYLNNYDINSHNVSMEFQTQIVPSVEGSQRDSSCMESAAEDEALTTAKCNP